MCIVFFHLEIPSQKYKMEAALMRINFNKHNTFDLPALNSMGNVQPYHRVFLADALNVKRNE